MEEPLHQHDCTTCIYLGEWNYWDLYLHNSPGRYSYVELIARRSSYGPDYSVGHLSNTPEEDSLDFWEAKRALVHARIRAKAKGLIS